MNEKWFQVEDYFEILTNLLRKSVGGGTVTVDSIADEDLSMYEEGVKEGFITKLDHVVCHGCDKTYSLEDVPDVCICGYDFPDDVDSNQIEYVVYDYPNLIQSHINDDIGQFKISYHRRNVEQIPLNELHFQTHDDRYLHISPHFVIKSGIHVFPGYNDVFLSWNRVPSLVTSSDEILGEITDFFSSLDDGREFLEGEGITFRPDNPSAPGSDLFERTEWFTLLHQASKSVAHERSKAAFDMNYNDLFELLGIDFLNTMFPQAYTFHAGGAYKPDGYVLLNEGSYLVESKCYSNDFKLFSEEDKAKRYIENYIDRIDRSPIGSTNLIGYIFISHSFNEGALPGDIRSFVRRNISEVNLDIICINDLMMKSAVKELLELYQMNPSARFRIYDKTDRYLDLLDMMADLTEYHGVDEQQFSSIILSEMKRIADEPTQEEQIIHSGFEGSSEIDRSLVNP